MNWIKPSVVSTPNIEDDIRNLLLGEILSLYQKSSDVEDHQGQVLSISHVLSHSNKLFQFR